MLIVISGPTASGKSMLTVRCAKKLFAPVISADARQVYKYLNIGTNKLTEQEMSGVPHYLMDIIEPSEVFTAGDFCRSVNALLPELIDKYKIVFLTGGTGFYIQSLLTGLDEMPQVPEAIKLQLQKDFDSFGLEFLTEELRMKDPVSAAQIDIQNPKRVLRALEVNRTSGLPFSQFKGLKKTTFPYPVLIFNIIEDRKVLYERINQRVLSMLEAGLLDEIKNLKTAGYLLTANAFQTIGYKEPLEFLNEKISYDEMINQIQQNTRRYAKRQITWSNNGLRELPFKIIDIRQDEDERVFSEIKKYF